MSCSGSLKKGRFGYQWQAALALVGPIYDTSVESTILPGISNNHFSWDGKFSQTFLQSCRMCIDPCVPGGSTLLSNSVAKISKTWLWPLTANFLKKKLQPISQGFRIRRPIQNRLILAWAMDRRATRTTTSWTEEVINILQCWPSYTWNVKH